MILGYGGGGDRARLGYVRYWQQRKTKGGGTVAIGKRCRLIGSRYNEAKRVAEEFILNLKLRDGAEREFVRSLAADRHHGRGGAIEKEAEGGLFRAVSLVQCQHLMDIGTETRLLLR